MRDSGKQISFREIRVILMVKYPILYQSAHSSPDKFRENVCAEVWDNFPILNCFPTPIGVGDPLFHLSFTFVFLRTVWVSPTGELTSSGPIKGLLLLTILVESSK